MLSIAGRAPKRTIKGLAERYQAGNLAAARIILADTTGRYQGLTREIAERALAAEMALATDRAVRRPRVRLADEPGGRFDLFDPAVDERGAA